LQRLTLPLAAARGFLGCSLLNRQAGQSDTSIGGLVVTTAPQA